MSLSKLLYEDKISSKLQLLLLWDINDENTQIFYDFFDFYSFLWFSPYNFY